MQQTVAHDNVADDFNPNTDAKAELLPTFEDSLRIIPCPMVTAMDAEHTLTRKTCFVCPYVLRAHLKCVDIVANCIHRRRSSGKTCELHEHWCECNWSSWSTSSALCWDSPNSHAISHWLHHGFRSTAATMTYSFSGVRTDRGRPEFTCVVGVTFLVSQTLLQWSKQVSR
jgi:hypothetical protein